MISFSKAILLLLAIWFIAQAQSQTPPDDAVWCYEAYPNGPEGCDDVGTPVCGYYTLRCLIPPCDILQYNYANPCRACLDNRDYFTPGACPIVENEAGETNNGEWEVWFCENGENGESEWWWNENENWGEEWVPEGEVSEGEVWIWQEP